MSLSVSDLVIRAAQLARGGASEADTGIWDDNVWRLVPNALYKLATAISMDPVRRGILTRSFGLPMLQGRADLASPALAPLLRSSLPYARFYEPEDSNQLSKYIWKASPAELRGWLNPAFGYFSIDGNAIYTRKVGTALPDALTAIDGGNAILFAVYIPDGGPNPIPDDAGDMAVETLAALAVAGPKEITAGL